MSKEKENLNIHQKLLKIADMAGVLQKNKAGFNYKYVTEEEIQAKITAGMQKYGVMLYPSLAEGTLTVEPYHYDKAKTKKVKDQVVDYTVPVNEVIVKAEVIYTWVNTDKPEETVQCRWAYIGQMEDASQAFGAGATYGNRYYLLKALQLATTEADPDAYRSKQKEAENYEENKELKKAEEELQKAIKDVVDKGSELMKKGLKKEELLDIVGKKNNGNQNPSSIKTIEICDSILEELNKKEKELAGQKKATTKGDK